MGNLIKQRKLNLKRIVLFVVGFLLIMGGTVSYAIYQKVDKSVDNMYEPLQKDSLQQGEDVSIKDRKPRTFLLLGVDERPNDIGRSDTMLLVAVNPDKKKTTIVSIPRDTRVFNTLKNRYTKINAAYVYGGVEGSVKTVEQFLNVPIDYYIKVNMEGFKDIVDTIGGVTVNNPFDFTLEGVHLSKGKQHLNGKEALKYVRMRKEDPRGDFGRQQRQREVLNQVIDEGTKISSITSYPKLLKVLENNVKTNLTFDQILDAQRAYKPAIQTIEELEMEGKGEKIDGIWYYTVTEETRAELSETLKTQLSTNENSTSINND
ncbi:LytR family transcriptional regulator [Niallia circulans]|uniref:LCP family glycopolymer transferase n=1 Tax=Niallia circulans TaxID=1397 RepID=UPI000BA77F16|nr:LCP family protein [Niallia circulans]PAD26046.1 LytR family transcriptional regulator [Niallia circulans]